MGSHSIIQEHPGRFKFGSREILFGDDIQKHRTRKNHNQYFTPEFAAEKAISFISEEEIKTIIDPAVGNGVFLKVLRE